MIKPVIVPQINSKSVIFTSFRIFPRLKYLFGKFFSSMVRCYEENRELLHVASVIEQRSLHDRLTDEQLADLTSHQDSTFDLDIRKKYFREADHSRTLHGIIVPHLEELMSKDTSIKSVLNIGCNYAYMDSLLAKKHPDVEFIGVDVNKHLDEMNADLKTINHRFIGDYAMDVLERGDVKPDLCYMSSTATVIRNSELRRYINNLSMTTKYVAFSEPVWILPGGGVIDPSFVNVEKSKPGYIQRRPITNDYGYMCYVHNYKKLLEDGGFEPIVYKFYRPDFTYLYWVVVIGQNKKNALWE